MDVMVVDVVLEASTGNDAADVLAAMAEGGGCRLNEPSLACGGGIMSEDLLLRVGGVFLCSSRCTGEAGVAYIMAVVDGGGGGGLPREYLAS